MTNGQEVRLRLQVAPFGLQYKKNPKFTSNNKIGCK